MMEAPFGNCYQEQSYSKQQLGWSLAWDHFHRVIANPCGSLTSRMFWNSCEILKTFMKHCKTLVKYYKTLIKHHRTLVKHSKTHMAIMTASSLVNHGTQYWVSGGVQHPWSMLSIAGLVKPRCVTGLLIFLISLLKIVFQEQSYSSLRWGWSSAWDHICGVIVGPCGIIGNSCGIIANPCRNWRLHGGWCCDWWSPIQLCR